MKTISQRGVVVVATAHGNNLSDVSSWYGIMCLADCLPCHRALTVTQAAPLPRASPDLIQQHGCIKKQHC